MAKKRAWVVVVVVEALVLFSALYEKYVGSKLHYTYTSTYLEKSREESSFLFKAMKTFFNFLSSLIYKTHKTINTPLAPLKCSDKISGQMIKSHLMFSL